MKHFQAIAAMAANRVIGQGNRIPWHLPEDFAWFKKKTLGNVLLMGRRTFDSIGKPLPGRTTWVLSRSVASIPGAEVLHSLSDFPLHRMEKTVFICGGAQLYEQTLPYCSDLFLTVIPRDVEGDAFFPPFEGIFGPGEVIHSTAAFSIFHYRNPAPLAFPGETASLLRESETAKPSARPGGP